MRKQVNGQCEVDFMIVRSPMEIAIGRELAQKGILTDSSDTGIGMTTDSHLEPGSFVNLCFLGKRQTGIVMWSLNRENGYRVGIRFIGVVPPSTNCF